MSGSETTSQFTNEVHHKPGCKGCTIFHDYINVQIAKKKKQICTGKNHQEKVCNGPLMQDLKGRKNKKSPQFDPCTLP